MTSPFLYGALAAASLPLGALIGAWLRPSARLTSAVMAFGAGALLAAMSFELVLPAMERDHVLALSGGLILGCAAFVYLNHLLNGQGAFLRKAATLAEYAGGVKRRQVEETLEELSKVDILRSLPPEEIQELLSHVSFEAVPAGEILVERGDPGDSLYIIESGTVGVFRKQGDRTTTVAHLSAGETFGEMALLTDQPRNAWVVSLEPVSLLRLLKADFDRLAEASPRLRDSVGRLAHEREVRNVALMKSEEWREKALANLSPEALLPTEGDVQVIVQETRDRATAGFAIWLGSALDGVGESVVIGATAVGAAASLPLMGGVFLANLPEAMSSASTMRRQGMGRRTIFWMWTSLVLLAGIFAELGYWVLLGAQPWTFSFFEAMAGGAILAMIAQTMLPEAFRGGGGAAVALMTVLGFLAGILLGLLTG